MADWGGPPMPTHMRAAIMEGHGGPEVLRVHDGVAVPAMAPHNEVLVEVHAAGVNPFESKLRRGWLAMLFPLAPGHVLGCDVAGVVAAKGFDVSELEVGERVWGLVDTMRSGAYAEYLTAPSYLLRRMPANLSFEEAAAVPMAGCTAWFALVNLGDVQAGQRVLIHAGAGGVGSFAIQIAKHMGAWVATTCSAANVEHCRRMGADEVIDYAATDFTQALSNIDLVIDPIGGEVNQRSYRVLKRGGTLVVILRGDQIEMANRERLQAEHGVTTKVVAFSAQPDILDRLREGFEAGWLTVPLGKIYPLDDIAQAHAQIDSGHTRGKLALKVR